MTLPENVSAKDANWILHDKYNDIPTNEYKKDIERLAKDEPLSYIIGWVPFLGLRIYLESRPLIPRNETEWWTEEMIKILQKRYGTRKFTFLDLCSGSGAIGCAVLSKIPNAIVSFGEINPVHKKTILTNIIKNKLDMSRANVKIGNLFAPFGKTRFDVIATNPPYIPDTRDLPFSVTEYEPQEALYAGKDGLDIIRSIATQLSDHIKQGGISWTEIDTLHVNTATTIFQKNALHTKVLKDLYGRPRVIMAY
ncbi:Protein-N(5)-glutamine methyltransferase PrmC, methylates polypeptide chain release factors RF1 and RF2 [hydrothermal vent metagenome]|uniref:peptide chain release factor N(5)-glutamine methyltransferase n=1 Tax=hydrothermal vent metagenome TaxID=652676 RepID=A0A3B0V4I5_9ZZZZ